MWTDGNFKDKALGPVDSQRQGNRERSRAGLELLGRGEPEGQR